MYGAESGIPLFPRLSSGTVTNTFALLYNFSEENGQDQSVPFTVSPAKKRHILGGYIDDQKEFRWSNKKRTKPDLQILGADVPTFSKRKQRFTLPRTGSKEDVYDEILKTGKSSKSRKSAKRIKTKVIESIPVLPPINEDGENDTEEIEYESSEFQIDRIKTVLGAEGFKLPKPKNLVTLHSPKTWQTSSYYDTISKKNTKMRHQIRDAGSICSQSKMLEPVFIPNKCDIDIDFDITDSDIFQSTVHPEKIRRKKQEPSLSEQVQALKRRKSRQKIQGEFERIQMYES